MFTSPPGSAWSDVTRTSVRENGGVRLITYSLGDRGARAGLLRDERVVDAWDALGGGGESVRELLSSGRLGELTEVGGDGPALSEVELWPPVPDPQKIV